MTACAMIIGFAHPVRAAGNLITNPGFETASSTSVSTPDGWIKGRWGTNTATFSYPVIGNASNRAAQVIMTSRTTGDAKWAFAPVTISAGNVYEYQNDYSSDVTTHVTLEIRLSNGTYLYPDIAHPGPSNEWATQTIRFTAPANAVSARVFHLINQVGSLTIDNVSLRDVTPSPEPINPILNPSFEDLTISQQPAHWLRGRWGVNTTSFVFPVTGRTGSNAARVEISTHTSGDAKWYFTEVPVTPGDWYEFSDYYQSSIPHFVTVRFQRIDGTFQYQDIGMPPAQSDWTKFSGSFFIPSGVKSITIFHLIKNVGWLQVDDYKLKKLPGDPTVFNKGYVSINFDDGWLSAYQNAIPILDTAGFKSNQFIVTSRMFDGFAAYVKVPQILAMQSSGHEIGAHTRTHPNLTTLTPEQAQLEISSSRDDLIAIGATPVNYFAFPEGGSNNAIRAMVAGAGFAGARGSDGGFNRKTTDRFNLARQPMTNTTTLAQVQALIDQAMTDKTWLILLFHEINASGNTFAVTPELFQQIVNYLATQNIAPITISQGMQMMN